MFKVQSNTNALSFLWIVISHSRNRLVLYICITDFMWENKVSSPLGPCLIDRHNMAIIMATLYLKSSIQRLDKNRIGYEEMHSGSNVGAKVLDNVTETRV